MYSKSPGKVKSKTHKTAFCLVPPADAWPTIQAIRKKHDRQFFRWMPHINLLYPFKPKSSFAQAVDLLSHVCSQIEPFEITLSKIKYFRHGEKNYTLWLEPEPAEKVVLLQEKAWQMIPECWELSKFSNGYTPHLSIGQAKSREKTMRLIGQLQTSWKPLRFPVTEVYLIWRRDPPQDKFRIGERIKLGKMVLQNKARQFNPQ